MADAPPGQAIPTIPAAAGDRVRVGVVLAAGRSERLRLLTRGRSKLLLRLGGLTLVERAVRSLLDAGLERVVVVVGHHAEATAEAARQSAPGRVTVVEADRWEAGNGATLAAAEPAVAGEQAFVLLCGDHVFAGDALENLTRAPAPAALVDPNPSGETWAEGTRVRLVGGRAVAFGKDLEEPTVDCGAFLLSPAVFPCHRAASVEGDDTLAGAVTRLAGVEPVVVRPLPPDAWWQDVDTPHDLRTARRRLRRSLSRQTDGPVSRYLNRPVSTRLTMAVAPLRLSPDLLSFLSCLVGMLAAVCLAWERPLMGGILVHGSSVLAGVDGETARLHLRETPRGTRLGGLTNRMVDAAVVAGLGIWVLQHTFSSRSIILLLGGIAVAWAALATAGMGLTTILGLPAAVERRVGLSLGGRDGRLFLVTAWAVLGHPMVALAAFMVAWVV
ncbi:MAG: hypothetical protein E6G44_06665 [Actinobacteria bacterium]|nr:MAG: hypothetical protein E6G44_06665 [Actinomycetota bacterium]